MTSGSKTLMGETLSWVAVAMMLTFMALNYSELKQGTLHMLGLPTPEELEAQQAKLAEGQAAEQPSSGTVELRAGDNGHFNTDAEVNGRSVHFMVDTGATMVALSYEDAESAGIYLKPSDFTHGVSTANGTARVAPVVIDRISIGDITVRNVQAAVSEPGRLTTSLLGMTFLSRLERFDMRNGTLLLED